LRDVTCAPATAASENTVPNKIGRVRSLDCIRDKASPRSHFVSGVCTAIDRPAGGCRGRKPNSGSKVPHQAGFRTCKLIRESCDSLTRKLPLAGVQVSTTKEPYRATVGPLEGVDVPALPSLLQEHCHGCPLQSSISQTPVLRRRPDWENGFAHNEAGISQCCSLLGNQHAPEHAPASISRRWPLEPERPSFSYIIDIEVIIWCPEGDLNPHDLVMVCGF
jgi:hypothetical protein